MTVVEQAITFDSGGAQLMGIASLPAVPGELGMVIVVGGPQYRAGSHRQFVQLARRAAADGVAVLRFDYGGMGDSDGTLRNFEQADADIAAAITALQQAAPSVQRIVLWGLCDGASAALLYLDAQPDDRRVAGLCLLNPWVRSAATLARTQVKHYYRQRVMQAAFWRKLLRGQVARQAGAELVRSVMAMLGRRPVTANGPPGGAAAAVPYTQRMARQWMRFRGSTLLMLSGDDYTAKEFCEALATDPAWCRALQRDGVKRVDLPGADHTLSSRESRLMMEEHCMQWLATMADATHPASPRCVPAAAPAHAR